MTEQTLKTLTETFVLTYDHEQILAENAALRAEIERLRDALKPFAAIDLLEYRMPPEFAMLVLRARGALTPNSNSTTESVG